MRVLLIGLAVALAPAALAQAARVAINERAAVASDDGYLNLRDGPTTRGRVEQRLPNGQEVLVLGCDRGRRGARWCHVILVLYTDDGFRVDPEYGAGYVYDAELRYNGPGPVLPTTVAGAGVPRGFEALARPWTGHRVVDSQDGYVNLRTGPSTGHDVLRRMANGEGAWLVARATGRGPSRWALLYTLDGELGYAYDAELAVEADHEH